MQGQLQQLADVYVVNPDTPQNSTEVRRRTGLRLPLLQDPRYSLADRFALRGAGPMGGLVGFVVIDAAGVIRVQRVDVRFGDHAGYILDAVRALSRPRS